MLISYIRAAMHQAKYEILSDDGTFYAEIPGFRKVTVRLPNPHGGDIGREFLLRILRQAGISREGWEAM